MRSFDHSTFWLLCDSDNMIEPGRVDEEVRSIVTGSCARNERRGITGAMIATSSHFAQYMEGRESAVRALAETIARDKRLANLRHVASGTRSARLFPEWSMAYAGTSVFMRQRVADMIRRSTAPGTDGANSLIMLIREFAHPID